LILDKLEVLADVVSN